MALTFQDHGLSGQADKYEAALSTYAEDANKHGTYPPTILVGLGGTGAKALQHTRRLTLERFGAVDTLEGVAYLSIDTDIASRKPTAEKIGRDPFVEEIAFKEDERLNVKANFREYLGPNLVNHAHIRDWWDNNLAIADDFNLEQGAGQIRPLSRLVLFANRQKIIDKLDQALNAVKSQAVQSPRVDQHQKTRVVIVAGLAGGTGSGMFLDFAAIVRQVVPDVTIEGYFALPGVYKGAEGVFPKIAANGYAALRELNHYVRQPFKVRWTPRDRETEERGLYDRHVIFSGTNTSNQQLGETSDCYALIGEQLFIDFSEGGLARWVQGVRINRAQYLMRSVDREYRIQMPDGSVVTSHADSWKTCFQSFGLSKIVFPSWRLLSYASYDLAAEMVGLMDPGKGGAIRESLTELRDEFAYRAGFFQGERTDEEGHRRASYLVVDALRALRGARTGANSFDDHLDMLAQELVDDSESMYANGSTREDMGRRFREVQGLLGDPFSAGNAGDWATLIDENKKLFVETVRNGLDEVVETFRSRPAVGPSGVAQLIDEIREVLGKPADQARYKEWFHRKKEEKVQAKQEAYLRWNKQVDYAVEAHTGLFKSEGNHREAVRMAADAFQEYWKACVHEYLCVVAVRALEDIDRVLSEEGDRLRRVCEAMFDMRSTFHAYRDFFSKPERATSITELEVPQHLHAQLLTPYIGYSEEEREERLGALLDRGLRDMRLTTLKQLEEMVRKQPDVFRQRLFKMCFMALKGNNGRTNAFRVSEDENRETEGFIQRYSAVKMLAEQCGDDRAMGEMLDRLYDQGLPWVRPHSMSGMGISEADVPKDCFLGFDDTGEERTGQRILKALEGQGGKGYRPRRIKVNDPSEIILYTECTAFPAAYVGELYDDNGLQRYYEDNLRAGTALHIHQDFHRYQDLLPLREGGVRSLKQAWKVFVLGLLLGRIRSEQPFADDETRFVYVYQRQVSAFEQRWEKLGPEMGAIGRLMDDAQLLQTMSRDVEEVRMELEQAGRYDLLLALCDYYFHCIFPVHRESVVSSGEGAEIVGSAENEAVNEIRDDIRNRARSRGGLSEADLARAVQEAMGSLEEWAMPSSRIDGRPSPSSVDLRPEDREFEWSLLADVQGRIPRVQGYIASRNALGERQNAFPRLRIDVSRAAADPASTPASSSGAAPGGGSASSAESTPPSLAEGDTYHYAGPSGRERDLSAGAIADKVSQSPNERHRVWREGLSEWIAAREEPAIAALLATSPPSLDAGPPPLDEEPPPLEDEPPPLDSTMADPELHYACDKDRLGKVKASAIAAAVRSKPEAEHKVWLKGWSDWKKASEASEVKAWLDDGPPPL